MLLAAHKCTEAPTNTYHAKPRGNSWHAPGQAELMQLVPVLSWCIPCSTAGGWCHTPTQQDAHQHTVAAADRKPFPTFPHSVCCCGDPINPYQSNQDKLDPCIAMIWPTWHWALKYARTASLGNLQNEETCNPKSCAPHTQHSPHQL